MKLVRVLLAGVAAVATALTVQIATSSSASAAETNSTLCFACWTVIDR